MSPEVAVPPPSYPALRKMRIGDVQVFYGGGTNQRKVSTIQTRAGGKFTACSMLMVHPFGKYCFPVIILTCIEQASPALPKGRKPTKATNHEPA